MKKDIIELIAIILVIIGGINWGLIGIANTNLVASILYNSNIENIVYDLVGLSAIYIAYTRFLKK